MLATAQDIHHAMNLSPGDIVQAFRNQGYSEQQVITARFEGFTGSSFVYSITFWDINGATADARVYVRMTDSVSKKLIFTAEY